MYNVENNMKNIKNNIKYELFNTVWLSNDPILYMLTEMYICELEFNYSKNV